MCFQQAEELAKQDVARLHKIKKLVLLVDLDQTLIHTTQNSAFARWCEDDKVTNMCRICVT